MPILRCDKHTTNSNLSRHITKHHPKISHLSLEKAFEVAHCTDRLADAKLHVKAEMNFLLRVATKFMGINGKFEERLSNARFAWLQR